jgi:hypothetical protein
LGSKNSLSPAQAEAAKRLKKGLLQQAFFYLTSFENIAIIKCF